MSSENLKRQLKNLDIRKLKMKNGKSVEQELLRHARVLADCILEELDKVYDSYNPKVYVRSFELYNSLTIDDNIEIKVSSKGANLSVRVYFDGNSMHQSFNGREVDTALLLNDGWNVSKGHFKDVEYLGRRNPTNYIEAGIEKYKRTVKNPFKIVLNKNDEITEF